MRTLILAVILTASAAHATPCDDARKAMARGSNGGETINRVYDSGGQPDTDCFCLASSCACWVWENDNQGHCGLVRR